MAIIKSSDLVSKEVKDSFAQSAKKTFETATGIKSPVQQVFKEEPTNLPTKAEK